MGEHSRYSVTAAGAAIEGEILKNKLGITEQSTLEDTETVLLSDTYTHFFSLLEKGEIHFSLKILFKIHAYFLGTLYTWAGKMRTVDISKEGILFTPAKYIPNVLQGFEMLFAHNLPAEKENKQALAKKLAIIHNELNAIHPFREGNG